MESFPISLMYLLLILRFHTAKTNQLTFNMFGFENCIFHLQFADVKYKTIDFVEQLVLSNQATRAFTITRMSSEASQALKLNKPRYFKEVCSVNFLIVITGCHDLDMNDLLGSRMYSFNNIVFTVHSKYSHCPKMLAVFSYRIATSVVALHFSNNSQVVGYAELYCPNFKTVKTYKMLKLPKDVPYNGLYDYCEICIR